MGIVQDAYAIIFANEGDYTSINCDDNGAVSIGKIQWHANRALYLMRNIIEELGGRDEAYKLSYQQLVDEIIDESTSWSNRIFSAADAKWTYPLLDTEKSRSVQDAQAYSDIQGYLEHAESLGVTEENAQIFMADIENQGGWGASDRIIKAAEGKDIDSLYIAASKDVVFQYYMPRRARVYYKLMGDNFEDGSTAPDTEQTADTAESSSAATGSAEGVEFVTGRLPELGGDDSWDNLSRYLHAHKTELNHIIESIYSRLGNSQGYESGETNGWEWRKFSDGTAECWRTVKCENVKCGTGWGSLLISADYGGIKYPFAFAERPIQLLSLSSPDKGYMLGYPNGSGCSTASNTGKWWFVRGTGTSGTETINVDIFVRGRLR